MATTLIILMYITLSLLGLIIFICLLLVNKIKYKTIKPNGNSSFIKRLTFYLKNGSIKIHLILSDDEDAPHTHPWNFTSFLIIPYKERIYEKFDGIEKRMAVRLNLYYPLSINKKECNIYHKTQLYRIFGIKIPALTIGWYSNKIQLCSFCQDLGYCKEQKKVENLNIKL